MSKKLPSFQFYPGDWLRDHVSGCSIAAQGLWLRMLLVAHDGSPYGHLAQNGRPLQPEVIARRCGVTLDEYLALLDELTKAGVPAVINGCIISRRMVRDQRERDEARNRKQRERERVSRSCHADVTPLSRDCHDASSTSSSTSTSEKAAAAAHTREDADGQLDPRIVALSNVGITPGAAYGLIGKHQPTIEAIESYIDRASQPDVNNRSAFVMAAIRESWPVQPRQATDDRNVNRVTQQANAQAERVRKRIEARAKA